MLQQSGLRVIRYSLKDADMFRKWKVDAVPTTILVSKKENKAFKLVGVIKMEDIAPLLSKIADKR
jgi:thioredoxin-related protein